jgi:hypothetical protein
MCNLYSITKSQQAIRDLAKAMRDMTGNMPPLPSAILRWEVIATVNCRL